MDELKLINRRTAWTLLQTVDGARRQSRTPSVQKPTKFEAELIFLTHEKLEEAIEDNNT